MSHASSIGYKSTQSCPALQNYENDDSYWKLMSAMTQMAKNHGNKIVCCSNILSHIQCWKYQSLGYNDYRTTSKSWLLVVHMNKIRCRYLLIKLANWDLKVLFIYQQEASVYLICQAQSHPMFIEKLLNVSETINGLLVSYR